MQFTISNGLHITKYDSVWKLSNKKLKTLINFSETETKFRNSLLQVEPNRSASCAH